MSHSNHFVWPTHRVLSVALASCLALATPTVLAQSTAATVRGQVTLDSAPATEATVTATNLNTGLKRTVSAPAGNYNVSGLPPGTYRIDVSAGGQSSSKVVTLQVGQTATLNVPVGGVAETAAPGEATNLDTVKVTAEVLAETKTSEIATYISNKEIESLPQGTRNFLAFADTVPGVQFISDASGNTRVRSGAQSANAVNVFIDGVGQKNYVTTGGVSGQDTSRGNPFPQSAIGEYKVITQNYKAEFDQVGSAAIVASTRSGTNDFSGSFFWDHTATDWRSKTIFEERSGDKVESKEEQYGVSFGGPIIQDVAHFFVAYEAKEYASPRSFNLGRGYTIDQLPAEYQQQYGNGSVTAPFKEDLYFAKLDWLFGDSHYFELTGKYRDESEIIQVQDQRLPSRGTDNTNEETRADLRYQFTNANWLNDAHLTYEDSAWSPQPVNFGPASILSEDEWYQTIAGIGGSDNYQDKGQKGWGFQDDLTFTGWTAHTVKMGVKYKAVDLETLEQNKYNPQFYYDLNESTTVPTHVEFGAPVAGFGNGTVNSSNKQYGIYIQDDWEVNDKLTLNLGVRWDYETTPSYEDYVTPVAVVDALLASNANLPNSSVNVNDYISTGGNRKADKNNWAPRIGFSYDLNADQRHVIFGGAGRSYDRNLFDYLQNETSKASWGQYVYNFNTPEHPCEVGVEASCRQWDPRYLDPEFLRASSVAGSREVYLNNNDLVVPYSDQFSVGMRNAFAMMGHDWQSEVTLSYVESHDGIAFLLGNRLDDGNFFPVDPPNATDPPPWSVGFAPFSNLILAQNALETKAKSVYLKLDKPYTRSSGWSATFAYTFTDSEQNSPTDGFPGAFNAEQVEDYGWFPGKVPEHRFVATGIYDGPWGTTLSGKLVWASSTPRYYQNCNVAAVGYCYFDAYEPDQDFKQFDLALSKEWDTGSDVHLRVRADLLNVFNWDNYSGYEDYRGDIGKPQNPRFGQPTTSALPTRTFKISFGLDW